MTDRLIRNENKLDAVLREITLRKRLYTKWVGMGRMSQHYADREIAIFESIAADYRAASEIDRIEAERAKGGAR